MKTFLSILGLAVLIGGTALLSSPAVAPCAYADFCVGHYFYTDDDFGTGPSCTAATSDLYDKVAAEVPCLLGTCDEELEITQECEVIVQNQWFVAGHLKYRCRIEIP